MSCCSNAMKQFLPQHTAKENLTSQHITIEKASWMPNRAHLWPIIDIASLSDSFAERAREYQCTLGTVTS